MKKELSLGIDTSNYKTSVAVVDAEGTILFNHQQFLQVKQGERGLRQSEALFQHVQNLPPVMEKVLQNEKFRSNIGIVAVSVRPRPKEGSYMPVFTAGAGYGRAVAAALGVSLHEVSHQEGHVEAVRFYSAMKDVEPLICFHFSGGTTEALLVDRSRFEIVGGSRDLAYGQVLDRIGVSMGLPFPCGETMDQIAWETRKMHLNPSQHLTRIKVTDGYVNLSGIETQGQRLLASCADSELVADLFEKLSRSVAEMTMQLSEKYKISNFLYAGGVSCSRYLREYLSHHLCGDLNISFGSSQLSSDNAVGVALLGGKEIWH